MIPARRAITHTTPRRAHPGQRLRAAPGLGEPRRGNLHKGTFACAQAPTPWPTLADTLRSRLPLQRRGVARRGALTPGPGRTRQQDQALGHASRGAPSGDGRADSHGARRVAASDDPRPLKAGPLALGLELRADRALMARLSAMIAALAGCAFLQIMVVQCACNAAPRTQARRVLATTQPRAVCVVARS